MSDKQRGRADRKEGVREDMEVAKEGAGCKSEKRKNGVKGSKEPG
jgi:hypothetical protein